MDQTISALEAAYDNGGHLMGVRVALLSPDSPRISAVELQFQNLAIVVSAVEVDDTIAVSLGSLSEPSPNQPSAAWNLCIGKRIQWVWLMTNQQGYRDGARFEFAEPDNSNTVIVELIVSASSLDMFTCTPNG